MTLADPPDPSPDGDSKAPPATIVAEGQITDPTGAGLAGATVRLFRSEEWPDGAPVAETETDTVGDFKITMTEAPTGTLVLVVTKQGCTDLVHRFDPLSDGPPEFLGATLPGNLAVTGRVVDKSSGEPVSGASVRLEGAGGVKTTQTDDQGLFSFKALSAGPAELTVQADGFGRERLSLKDLESITDELIIELKPQRTVSISIVDDLGKAIRGVVIECYDRDRDHFEAVTSDDDGKATIAGWHFDAEELSVRLTHDTHVSDGDFERTISFPTDELNALSTLVMQRAGTIKGRVVSAASGEPVYGARVITGDTYSDATPRDWTDTDGRFDIRGVAPGAATVTVHAADYAPELQTVSVQAGGPVELRFRLSEPVTVTGVVKNAAGEPVAGAEIKSLTWRGATTLALRAIADGEGRFTLRGAPLDAFDLAALACGYKIARLTVDPASKAPLEFILEPLPDNSEAPGRIRAGDKAPEFRITALNGTTYEAQGLRGKFVILDFWATWCPPCIDELPVLAEIHKKYKARDDFVLIGVSRDFNTADLRAFLRRNEPFAAWPHAVGEENGVEQTRQAFGVSAIPRLFIIGPDGVILDADLRGARLSARVDEIMNRAEKPDAAGAP